MKLKLMIMTALTAVLVSATSASAVSVAIVAKNQTALDLLDAGQSLDLGGGSFDPIRITATGNLSNIYRSPWEGDTNFFATTAYYSSGTSGAPNLPNPAILKFNTAKTSLQFLWGSVDTYNELKFSNNTGISETVFGQDLLDLGATQGLGAALVNISGLSQAFSQVEFFSRGSNAFEFSNITALPAETTSVVPLPAALPLYGTGLAIMGFIGWRRKRKGAAAV